MSNSTQNTQQTTTTFTKVFGEMKLVYVEDWCETCQEVTRHRTYEDANGYGDSAWCEECGLQQ